MKYAYFLIFIIQFSLFSLQSCNNVEESNYQNSEKSPFFKINFNPNLPGCGECHKNVNERDDSLASKANKGWPGHNFNINSKMMSINNCLTCHKVDSGGDEGSIAPTSLRTIVHLSHMSNPKFEGNCFTCHYIMGDNSPDLYDYAGQ